MRKRENIMKVYIMKYDICILKTAFSLS